MGEIPTSRTLRVCVTGSECTGKTTVASALGRHFHAPIVPEAGRAYFEAKLAQGDPSVTAADIMRVVELQSRLEAEMAAGAGRLLICDTDIFTVSVWHERYVTRPWEDLRAEAARKQTGPERIDLYLLADPDFAFIHDGVRASAGERADMHLRFRERLIQDRLPFLELSGAPEVREAAAIAAVEALLADSV